MQASNKIVLLKGTGAGKNRSKLTKDYYVSRTWKWDDNNEIPEEAIKNPPFPDKAASSQKTDIPQFASDFFKFISCYIITTTAIKGHRTWEGCMVELIGPKQRIWVYQHQQ